MASRRPRLAADDFEPSGSDGSDTIVDPDSIGADGGESADGDGGSGGDGEPGGAVGGAGDGGSGGDGEPGGAGPDTANEPGAKRKTRSDAGKPRGPRGPRRKKEKVQVNIAGIEALLFGIHYGIALRTNIPEFVPTAEQTSLMARAIVQVSDAYPVLEKVLNEKSMAVANLAAVFGGTYFEMYKAYAFRVANGG